MRPSANVTNWRPIAPPYNNFAPVLFTIFVGIGTCHPDIDLDSLCWHFFRDSPNSSVQPKFRFRLKQPALDILPVLTWPANSLSRHSKKLTPFQTSSKFFWIWNMKSVYKKYFFKVSHLIKPTTASSLLLKLSDWCLAQIWHLTLYCDENGLFLLTSDVSGPGCVGGLWSPLSLLRAPAPVTATRDSPACCLTRETKFGRMWCLFLLRWVLLSWIVFERVGKKLWRCPLNNTLSFPVMDRMWNSVVELMRTQSHSVHLSSR